MAKIRDMIPAFELLQPDTVEDAMELLDRHRDEAWVLAGGLDSFDWFKDRIKRPNYVVDLGGIEEMNGIRDVDNGLEIGAMTSLTDIVRDANGEVISANVQPAKAAAKCCLELARAAGPTGMVAGQVADLEAENSGISTLEELQGIHKRSVHLGPR